MEKTSDADRAEKEYSRFVSELVYQLMLDNRALLRGREPSLVAIEKSCSKDRELFEKEVRFLESLIAGRLLPTKAYRNPLKRVFVLLLKLLLRPMLNVQTEVLDSVRRSLLHMRDYLKSYLELGVKAFETDFNRSFMNLIDLLNRIYEPQIARIAQDQAKLFEALGELKSRYESAASAWEAASLTSRSAGQPEEERAASLWPQESHWRRESAGLYLDFEQKFRQTSEELKSKYRSYIAHFVPGRPVVDLGCGRGEMLEVLAEAGFECLGVDANSEMVELCRSKGLRAEKSDVFTYLSAQEDGSISNCFCGMLIEHLLPEEIARLILLLKDKMSSGGRLLIETINPGSLSAIVNSFIMDMSHRTLVHNLTLEFLLEHSGFEVLKTVFVSPCPGERGLKMPELDAAVEHPELKEVLETIRRNFEAIDNMLFGFQEYVTISTRL